MIIIGDIMRIKKDSLLMIFLFSLSGMLIAFSANAKAGAQSGLSLAGGVIVPSLLPLLIIFNAVIYSGTGRIIDNLLCPITSALRLPRCAGAAILFGLIGGYPTGALLTQELYKNNDIDEKSARCIMRFNVNGGDGAFAEQKIRRHSFCFNNPCSCGYYACLSPFLKKRGLQKQPNIFFTAACRRA